MDEEGRRGGGISVEKVEVLPRREGEREEHSRDDDFGSNGLGNFV